MIYLFWLLIALFKCEINNIIIMKMFAVCAERRLYNPALIHFEQKCLSNLGIFGIINKDFDNNFKLVKHLILEIFKQFGFGKRIMETRILMEVETIIQQIRLNQGKPFDPRETFESSIANVTLSILFGRRFDRNDPEFRQVLADVERAVRLISPEIDIFPFIRFLPHFRNKVDSWLASRNGLVKFCNEKITALLHVGNISNSQ